MKKQVINKRILFFLQSGVGGAERMTVLIARFLEKAGYSVHFAVLSTNRNSSGIVHFIPDHASMNSIDATSLTSTIKGLNSALRTIQPACCFSSVININNKVLLLRKFFPRTRFIIRCDNYLYSYSRIQKVLIKLTYKRSDAIIAQTKEMKDELVKDAGIDCKSIIVLQNPIDILTINAKLEKTSSPYPFDNRYHVVSVGRFAFQKGYDYLVNAINILINEGVKVDLYIVGAINGENESEYSRVRQIILEKELDPFVHCVGYQDNPYVYMKYADCFALSSRWEGLPNSLVEALYLGTPVAAVKCIPVISRIVKDGVDGYLAESEDEKSLANAIKKALVLGKISSSYTSSKPEDFVALFDRVIMN